MEIKIENNKKAEAALIKAMLELQTTFARIGWDQHAVYPNGTSVALIAAQNEYGNPAKNIPPRSFMRTTIAEKSSVWRKDARFFGSKVIEGKLTAHQMMEGMGLKIAGNVRAKITEIWEPPLAPGTIYARAHRKAKKTVTSSLAKPLIDTGKMLNSLSNEVIES